MKCRNAAGLCQAQISRGTGENLQVRNDFGPKRPGAAEFEDVNQPRTQLAIDYVAVNRADAEGFELFGIIGQGPDFIPEQGAVFDG